MFAGYRGVARIWQWAKNIFFTFGNWKFLCYMHSKVIPLLRSWRISENMLQLMHFSVRIYFSVIFCLKNGHFYIGIMIYLHCAHMLRLFGGIFPSKKMLNLLRCQLVVYV